METLFDNYRCTFKDGKREESREEESRRKIEKKDDDRRCDYCIGKGWKGLNYTKSKCYTKKRETRRSRKKAKVNEDNCYIKV